MARRVPAIVGCMPTSPDPTPPGAVHRTVDVPGGHIHLVEQGDGPLVLLVHGFPESWYAWRHQLPALAAAGYRAVAIDVRGYGGSSAPDDVAAYGMLAHVSDDVGVVRALGAGTAVVVGHDWGAPIAANSALLRPDVFTAVATIGVPYAPRGGMRPTDAFAMAGGDEEFYVSWFQEPGRADAEIAADPRGWLRGFHLALAGEADPPAGARGVFTIPPGGRMRDRFPGGDVPLPPWLTDADLDVAAGMLSRTGPGGPLARYRNVDRDWEDLAAWDGAPVTRPALFVAGERDASLAWMADAIAAFPRTLPGLVSSHILPGCGHWVPQERPAELNRILIDWLRALPA
jgi:pimeloyl-ACP methyl ester carboxylesterase